MEIRNNMATVGLPTV